eukprot:7386981-Prymnesium_polylepis.3
MAAGHLRRLARAADPGRSIRTIRTRQRPLNRASLVGDQCEDAEPEQHCVNPRRASESARARKRWPAYQSV